MTDATGGAKGPDELRRQIERTRSELGNTVEELAGKADVKGRARARAADLRDKAGAMTVQLRSSAAQAGLAIAVTLDRHPATTTAIVFDMCAPPSPEGAPRATARQRGAGVSRIASMAPGLLSTARLQ